MRIPILTALLIAGFLAQGHAAARDKLPDPPSNFIPRPAVFHVGTDIVNPDLQAFTLTAGYVGNSMLMFHNGGFEPYAYRDQIWVGTDADNRIIPKSSNDIHGWE